MPASTSDITRATSAPPSLPTAPPQTSDIPPAPVDPTEATPRLIPADHASLADVDRPPAHLATTVTLRFAVDPPGAVIILDGRRISGSELAVARDAAAHYLRITAAGYLGHDETISFDESQRLVVQLRHAAGPTRGSSIRKDGSGADRVDRVNRVNRIDSKSPYE
jgi:hypothetical protein